MADTENRRNSAITPVYRTNGAAAYDIRRIEEFETGNAARRLKEPERRRQVRPRPKPKAKLAVAPLGVLGLLAAACMLLFVISGYVRLFEESTAVSALRAELTQAQEYQQRLQATYDSKIDLDVIQQQATAMGMTMPNSKQTVYLTLTANDKAVISGAAQESVAKTAWQALRSSIRTLAEYFG